MKIELKQKSEVEFNGDRFDSHWTIPYASSVRKEFNERYNDIIRQFQELMDEINWNNIIYDLNIKFKPVIGKSYFLYIEDGKYFLSMISPTEWRRECVGEFVFDHNGKWNRL